MTTEYFTKDYVTYDKYGLVEVRCMATNIPIKSRMEEVSKIDPSRVVYVIGNYANYREVPVLLADNSVSFIMVSSEMENVVLSEEDCAKISNQISRGKELELKQLGRPANVIAAILGGMKEKKKVVRRLSAQEINERFGGNK